ncbi:PREDICTED: uncharacterized protein LOC106294396 [Brassica oleracea var. oleracea]|uniref:uncharacterized protein LOC106294396 n=1 Tax=Brassica oleracea var. oleracea TaxID=109376 RepID=UPI0006A756C1|nr:PREDICTED: uncharacterized protein LOC106294396 [Brassica oleracea var. oleracea]
MMPNPSQTPSYSSTPHGNEVVPNVGATEFPEFSKQMALGGMSGLNEATPNADDSTSTRRKSPKWATAQNLVLLSGWIKYGTDSVIGRNQKSDAYWGKITEYCNEHCSFDPPGDLISCRNHFNYVNKILGKWIGAYDNAKRLQQSGWSENDILAKAHELYSGEKNGHFNLMSEWLAVHDQPRYGSQVGGNTGSGSSGSKRRRYFKRDHAAANQRLVDDYFSNQPTYDDAMYRRRFRMRKHVFLWIVGDLSSSDDYFTQRFDAANKEGISPLEKCTTAMQMLAYGVAADAVDEYIKIGGTTALECLRRFCKGIIQLYEQVYLRAPTQDDLQRILHVSEKRGFPGMIGSIDCMHWEWKNCPTAWEGQFTRGDKGTTTMLFFGCPGTLNDINVLDRSSVFDDVEQGNTPRVNFFVNQRPYNMAYYLADGIYPSYPTFIKLIRLPQSEPNKLFAQVQEGCRKDIEHAFGVLHARFKIIREPARMWDISDLAIIMRSCIILHNMIVEDERDTYAQHWTDYDQSEASGSNAPQPFSTEVLPAFANHVRARSELELRDSNVHHELQADLVKHI